MTGKEADSPARKNANILNGLASLRGQSCQCGDLICAKQKSAADSKCRGILSDGATCENALNSSCMSMQPEWLCLTCRTLKWNAESEQPVVATPALSMDTSPPAIIGADQFSPDLPCVPVSSVPIQGGSLTQLLQAEFQ